MLLHHLEASLAVTCGYRSCTQVLYLGCMYNIVPVVGRGGTIKFRALPANTFVSCAPPLRSLLTTP
jgi:hypothetical protein